MSRELRVIQIDPSFFPETGAELAPMSPVAACRDRMEQLVRSVYIAQRREAGDRGYGEREMARWDGGEDSFGVNHQRIWPRIVAHIARIGANPIQYIVAQFHKVRRDRLPLPNQLLGDAAVDRWSVYVRLAVTDLRQQLKWEMDSVNGKVLTLQNGLKWPRERAIRYALYNVREVQATALLRYCLAVDFGVADIAEHYHEQALAEYAFQKQAYDESWQTCIPPTLKEEGQRFLSQLTG